MKSALDEYAEAVETYLSRYKGREYVLSPPEFALLRNWYQAHIPLALILAAIDEVVGDGAQPSLVRCRRLVEARWGTPQP